MSKVVKENLLSGSQETREKAVQRIAYCYPESIKKAKKKYEDKQKSEGKVKLQTTFLTPKSQKAMKDLAQKLGGWQAFVDQILIVLDK